MPCPLELHVDDCFHQPSIACSQERDGRSSLTACTATSVSIDEAHPAIVSLGIVTGEAVTPTNENLLPQGNVNERHHCQFLWKNLLNGRGLHASGEELRHMPAMLPNGSTAGSSSEILLVRCPSYP
ncbi:hypothetical protein FIBSPDRAFT_65830 [Athelia psychrophila]|uniref:Uncharacterized protein n=1 Tax=Athelia psychrophila TaxID=1759441 RepID=A0A166EXS6_9AGAM|nr:hypothetical protein FIBSPDRAFT_65830 [Fibularhizoctonia sp. CBS 109695]